ncbi:MAG: sortase [Candidatus Levybacteria bacterium]|nr:sortase [Candidatus Levybacteria bacterium]
MSKIYYKKKNKLNYKKFTKGLGIGLFLLGALVSFYVFSPLILWQIYSVPSLSSGNIKAPIPRSRVVNSQVFGSLVAGALNSISGVDYTNAKNWFPGYKTQENLAKSPSYTISIPSIDIKDANVSTSDYDLSKHLVNYQGTSTPPNSGNAVIFGHSTLPQLFSANDYKTILANAVKLKIGDEILAKVDGVTYKYNIYTIYVVDAQDTSLFGQTYDNSYLTLVTCTPPGTTWKRLVIKAKLERI